MDPAEEPTRPPAIPMTYPEAIFATPWIETVSRFKLLILPPVAPNRPNTSDSNGVVSDPMETLEMVYPLPSKLPAKMR